jgi:hypothetical protein
VGGDEEQVPRVPLLVLVLSRPESRDLLAVRHIDLKFPFILLL